LDLSTEFSSNRLRARLTSTGICYQWCTYAAPLDEAALHVFGAELEREAVARLGAASPI
jgi:hypothetical protein